MDIQEGLKNMQSKYAALLQNGSRKEKDTFRCGKFSATKWQSNFNISLCRTGFWTLCFAFCSNLFLISSQGCEDQFVAGDFCREGIGRDLFAAKPCASPK